MRISTIRVFAVCIIILVSALLFSACGLLDFGTKEEKHPVRMTAVYVGEDDKICGSYMADWDIEAYLHWSDGTIEKTKKFEYVTEDRNLEPENTIRTFTVKSTEYDLTATVDISIPEHINFPETREEFCQRFYDLMKAIGVTRYTMDIERNEYGVITEAVFKTVIGGYWSYWYYLEFSNFPYDPESIYFDRVKLDTNVQYDKAEMEKLKLLLLSMTIPADTYTAGDAYELINRNDGRLVAGNVEYLAYFKQNSTIVNGPVYYMTADIVQLPVYAVNSEPQEPDLLPDNEVQETIPESQDETVDYKAMETVLAVLIIAVVIIVIAVIVTNKKNNKKVNNKEKQAPVPTQPVAVTHVTAQPIGGKCVACGRVDVTLEYIEIPIMGTPLKRAMCPQCASKFKQ